MAFEIIELIERDGRQVVPIPEKFRIDDDKVYITKVGNFIHLIPYNSPTAKKDLLKYT